MIQAAYIHIPFCNELCYYCDFHKVYIARQPVDTYIEMLDLEIQAVLQNSRPKMNTVYIGGGTPTALSIKQMNRLLQILHRHMEITSDTEFTIEGNPNDITETLARIFTDYGVNRISLGAQTFESSHLVQMNRTHTPEQIEKAVLCLIKNGLENINLDFIYGYPNHQMSQWRKTLKKAVHLPISHISAYSLIVEPKTQFYFMEEKGQLHLPDEDIVADMYETAMDFLPVQGFRRYELSNYAKKGYESQHNLIYWDNNFYYGFGAGAHSYTDFTRIQNIVPVMHYIKALQSHSRPILYESRCTQKEQMEEEMFLGLRKATGVSKEKFFHKFGVKMQDVFLKSIEDGKNKGLIEETATHIFLTRKGCLLGNEVFATFLLE